MSGFSDSSDIHDFSFDIDLSDHIDLSHEVNDNSNSPHENSVSHHRQATSPYFSTTPSSPSGRDNNSGAAPAAVSTAVAAASGSSLPTYSSSASSVVNSPFSSQNRQSSYFHPVGQSSRWLTSGGFRFPYAARGRNSLLSDQTSPTPPSSSSSAITTHHQHHHPTTTFSSSNSSGIPQRPQQQQQQPRRLLDPFSSESSSIFLSPPPPPPPLFDSSSFSGDYASSFSYPFPVVLGAPVISSLDEQEHDDDVSGTSSPKLVRSRSFDDVNDLEKRSSYPSSVEQFRIRRRAFSFSELDRQQREEQRVLGLRQMYAQEDRFLAAMPMFERNTTIAMMTKTKEIGGERPRWSSKTEYLLTSVGYAVGLGNLWRFPYLCYENGGGVFLIPYFTCLVLLGIPMFMMEIGIGQRMQMGFLRVWRSISARLTGIGISSVLLAMLCSVYYNIIIAWSLFYLFNSFQYTLPWSKGGLNAADSAKKFYFQDCLQKAASMNGELPSGLSFGFNWPLLLCLTLAWVLVYVCVFKGIGTSGKVVYFTAIFPYIGLLILFFRGVTLKGAGRGIAYYLLPDWSKLIYVRTWATAGSQIFYSLGIAWGSLVNFASFNPVRNNFFLDTYVVTCVNAFTSLFAGFVVFSIIGYMAELTNLPVNEVAKAGSGLAFVVYPAGLASMAGSSFFSILFFIMILCLGIDVQFAMMEVMITSIIEASWFKGSRKEFVAAIICLSMWCVGWLFISPVGAFWVDLMDTFTGTIALYVVALCEVFAVVSIYGLSRFSKDIYFMTGKHLHAFKFLYKWVLPIGLLLLIFCGVYMFAIPQQGTQHFVETKASGEGRGCGGNPACGGKGECVDSMCVCSKGFGGMNCTDTMEAGVLWCPENCNSEIGRGLCNSTSGECLCMSDYEGLSCMGDRYAIGWPGWAIALGWLFALGTLVPIPLVAVWKTLRRQIKRGIDEQGPSRQIRFEMELPPTFGSTEVDEDGQRYMDGRSGGEGTATVPTEDSDSSDDDLRIYGTQWELSSILRCRPSRIRRRRARHRGRRPTLICSNDSSDESSGLRSPESRSPGRIGEDSTSENVFFSGERENALDLQTNTMQRS